MFNLCVLYITLNGTSDGLLPVVDIDGPIYQPALEDFSSSWNDTLVNSKVWGNTRQITSLFKLVDHSTPYIALDGFL